MLSNNLTQGKLLEKLSQYTKSKYAVASNSGTLYFLFVLWFKKNDKFDFFYTSAKVAIVKQNCLLI